MTSHCFPVHKIPENESALKRSKFFPLRVDPFSEERQNNFGRVVSPESVPIPLNNRADHILPKAYHSLRNKT